MSTLRDKEYKRFEDIKHIREDRSEFWSARELATALEHNKWENFNKVIKRAIFAYTRKKYSTSRKRTAYAAKRKGAKGKLMLDE